MTASDYLDLQRRKVAGMSTGGGTNDFLVRWTPSGSQLGTSLISDDGTYIRYGNTHDDVLGGVQMGRSDAALVVEAYRDTKFLMWFFQHDKNESLSFVFQFSHRKNLTTALDSVHIHYVPMVNPVAIQNVYYEYQYSWQKIGDVFPAVATWTTGNATCPIDTTDAFKHKIFSIVTNIAAPANETYSSVLLFYVARLGLSASDTYNTNKAPPGTETANLGLLYVDAHFITNRDGSLNETTD